jgi:hypothetical protein
MQFSSALPGTNHIGIDPQRNHLNFLLSISTTGVEYTSKRPLLVYCTVHWKLLDGACVRWTDNINLLLSRQ